MACFQGWNCCLGRGDRNRSKGKKGEWRIYSLKELQAATNNFNYDNKLGEGSFGSVYWGQLWDGSHIAVKRLKVWSTKAEMEFSVEVEILGRVRHKNLLNLRGYCADGQERLIVYDYMPNMSLLAHLHGQFSSENLLDWNKRMTIAVGTAEGIAYLHRSATPHIIHRNIKASNVLLDSEFQPKVADFGLTKLIPEGDTHITAKVRAQLGYPAPESDTSDKASESSDVYSYGILLLELVSGRKPIDKLGHEMKCNIIEWAGPLLIDGKVEELIDPKLEGRYDEEELMRVLNVATMCAQSSPQKRPSLSEVVGILKGMNKEDDGATTEEGQVVKKDVKSDLPEPGKGINHSSD